MSDTEEKTFCEPKEKTERSREYSAWKTVYSKTGGYVADEVSFEFIEEGNEPNLCISANDRNHWVYLSPFQIAYLLELLSITEKEFVNKVLEQMKK